jgi:hypothetical protein
MTLRAAGARWPRSLNVPTPRRLFRFGAAAGTEIDGTGLAHRGTALLHDMLIDLPCPKRPDGSFPLVPPGVVAGEKMWINPGRLG